MKKQLHKYFSGLLAALCLVPAMSATSGAQTTYSFTTGGATGFNGPTQAQLNTAYSATPLNGQVTSAAGVQNWTVPADGTYRIVAKGARGGGNGGNGASMEGVFQLTSGQVLKIVVGQRGTDGTGGDFNGGGGGGGSFVATNSNTLLIAAGGGGGGLINNTVGYPGLATTNGGSVYNSGGGTGGNGGQNGQVNGAAAGGGGFNTDGQNSNDTYSLPCEGGKAFVNGAGGGEGGTVGSYFSGHGGFGGGGAGWTNVWNRSGGGGGYSGGQGGTWSSNPPSIGGGGGSFNSGTLQVNTAGANSDAGSVTITNIVFHALAFDGTDDYVSLPGTTPVPINNSDYTIEAWIRPNTMGVYGIIGWGPWAVGGSVNALRLSPTGIINYWWGPDLVVTTGDISGAWHHVAATYNGTTRMIYLDGNMVGSDVPPANSHTVPNATNLRIGSTNNGEYFNGSIEEVRVWNRALCASELSANRNGTLTAPLSQTGLVAYFRMDQGVASGTNTGLTTLYDSSASASHGTLVNFGSLTGAASNYVLGTTTITGALPLYAPLPPGTSSERLTRTISSTTTFTGCGPIVTITPTGGSGLTGSVMTRVTNDGTVQTYNGQPYVQRHYDIEPAITQNSATANVTLYFTQAEFTAYNAHPAHGLNLPVDGTDAANNKANLRITQFHGVPTGANIPANYPFTWGGAGPARVMITPTSMVYNGSAARWEVTIPVTGFSGFFASSNTATPLPVKLETFTASRAGEDRNRVYWKTAAETAGTSFEVMRSGDGASFTVIGTVAGSGGADAYTFYDENPLAGTGYYRLQIRETDGEVTYSPVAVVSSNGGNGSVTVSPVPARDVVTITNSDPSLTGRTATIYSADGRLMERFVIAGTQSLNISKWAVGVYMLHLPDGTVVRLARN